MNKLEFLNILNNKLIELNIESTLISKIIFHYDDHFSKCYECGQEDDEIIENLGDLDSLYDKFLDTLDTCENFKVIDTFEEKTDFKEKKKIISKKADCKNPNSLLNRFVDFIANEDSLIKKSLKLIFLLALIPILLGILFITASSLFGIFFTLVALSVFIGIISIAFFIGFIGILLIFLFKGLLGIIGFADIPSVISEFPMFPIACLGLSFLFSGIGFLFVLKKFTLFWIKKLFNLLKNLITILI